MEEKQRRISRLKKNRKKYRRLKKLTVKTNYINSINNTICISKDDEIVNTSKTRVRRSERNKRKKRIGIFGRTIKNRETTLIEKDRHMKTVAILLIIVGIIIMGIGLTCYFKNHFYFGTSINCLNVSGKSVIEVEKEFKENISNYNLKIIGRDDIQDEIRGTDIGLNYDESKKSEIEQIKDDQNKLSWIKAIFAKKENGINHEYTSSIITYDKDKLQNIIDNFNLLKDENISEPEDALLKYDGKSFEIEKEIEGNKLNKEKLYYEILKSISSGKSKLYLDKEDCYEKPKYISSSKELIEAKNKMNEYKDFKLTYELGKDEEVIYGDKLLSFFEFTDNFSINEDKVSAYVDELCNKYNTYGRPHNFITTDGRNITINGGDYGYKINRTEELSQIKQDIEGKKPVNRKFVYSQTAFGDITNDIGNTYIEIDMGKQHLWFYKDGNLVTHGDVVTGNVYNGTATPEGVYSLKYKVKDTFLIGENYKSYVNFWMPFNNNIGLHDASWRNVFGGNIYLSNGSHGCVNLPYSLAESIYNNIEKGIPVVCYN